MLQAAVLDGVFLDTFSPFDDGLIAAEVDVSRRQIADALMVTMVVVVIDEPTDLPLEVTRQEVIFEQDAVLQRLMPALDLALGLGVVWRAADMLHATIVEVIRQITGNVRRTVVRQETWLVNDLGMVTTRIA